MSATEYAARAADLRALAQSLEVTGDEAARVGADVYVAISYLRLAAAKLEAAAKTLAERAQGAAS